MLLQMLIIVISMGMLGYLVPYNVIDIDTSWHTFASGYLLAQSEAIRYHSGNEFVSEDGQRMTFNASGNVPYPRTIHFAHHDIVIELGGGRLVEK